MSTRWYPLYQKGNPQLRVFLPNFWMKLVKPEFDGQPSNIVQFHVSMEMTKHDVKNYLKKIYNVPVIKVNTKIKLGKFRRNELNTVIKDDDIKVAYVLLPRTESFVFPNMFTEQIEKRDEEQKPDKLMDKFVEKVTEHNKTKPGLPMWFQ